MIADSEALAAGKVTSEELVARYLARIEGRNPSLNAFVRLDGDGALSAARASDARRAAGAALGPIDGVPIGLKDIFLTKGLETTCASRILQGYVPPYEGGAVARLRAAGAVVLGKLNMDEFAMGSSGEHSVHGPCRNPWDEERTPGGSSGGAAAAVAADLCGGALGTDTGGSIRQPASFCGVTGLKPTYGRVSRYGVIAFASSLDQVGPIGKGIRDCAQLLQVIAGHDPADSTSIDVPVPDYLQACERPARGLRLGVPAEYFGEGADPEVTALVRDAIGRLEAQGCVVQEVSLPHTDLAVATYYILATAEASSNLARYDGVRYGRRTPDAADLSSLYEQSRAEGFGPEVRRRIMLGAYVLSAGYYDAYYLRASKVRALIRRDFLRAFEQVDIIVCPTSPTPAFKLGEKTDDPLSMYLADVYTIPCNLAGLPGLSVPCERTAAGLPVGLQLLARPWGEPDLFAAAAAVEASAP